MWSSSKKHQLLLTWAPGQGVEPGSRGHEADALPLSYPHIPLGIDFLQKFKMTLDLANRQLLHSGTATAFSSTSRKPVINGVSVCGEFMNTAEQLLAGFPEVTDIARATRSLQHDVK